MYILHKINFFPLLQNLYFFLLLFFFQQGMVYNERNIFRTLNFIHIIPSPTYSFSFLHQGGEKWKKNFISLNFYIYFPQTTYFFYFFNSPLPLLAGSILQNIHPCFIVKLGWWLISIEPKNGILDG